MITETQLEAIGYENIADDTDETIMMKPKGNIAISLEETDGIPSYEIAIYRDCIDDEGYYASEPVFTFDKNQSLTIEQFIQFTEFIENE